jgi:signal transduction histidine kinase
MLSLREKCDSVRLFSGFSREAESKQEEIMHQKSAQGQQVAPRGSGKQRERTQRRVPRLRLLLARALWLLIALFEVGVLLVNLPVFIRILHTACSDPTGVSCNYLQLRSAQLPALAHYGFSLDGYALYAFFCDLIVTLLFLSMGILIFWRKSAEFIGLFVSLLLLTFGCFGISEVHLVIDPPFEGNPIVGLLAILQWPALGIFFYTFPDGHFVPRWSWMLTSLFVIQEGLFVLPYPYNIDSWPPLLNQFETLLVYGSAVGTQIYRYRAVASPLQRLQIKWLAFGFAMTLAFYIVWNLLPLVIPALNRPDSWYPLLGPVAQTFPFVPIPLGIGIALLRYRLWDIDIIINRTLVYAGLSASTLGLYVLVVSGASSLVRAHNDVFFSLLATALIAVLFQPLRQWLQQGVNRVMFGERNEPYRVLSRLGQRLEETLPASSLLPTIVETVARALKLPYVAIVCKREQPSPGALPQFPVAAFGSSRGGQAVTQVPLIHQGQHLGELVLSPRGRGEELTPADLRLVRDLAPQIGMALHSALLLTDLHQMTVDLQRSRMRLVTAREEERRRLRRDLHDGLGPQLSSQTLTLSAIKKVLRQNPEMAEHLLTDAITHAQEAIADIRRLVYALRPPALDDLGLLQALQEQIHQYEAEGIRLSLDAPRALPPLPAAIEMACYRIVQEALTNVVRHAHATEASVQLRVQEALVVEVTDNGRGLPPGGRSGVGFASMHERAEELGGTCLIESRAAGGTRVCARLPLLVGRHEEHEAAKPEEEV